LVFTGLSVIAVFDKPLDKVKSAKDLTSVVTVFSLATLQSFVGKIRALRSYLAVTWPFFKELRLLYVGLIYLSSIIGGNNIKGIILVVNMLFGYSYKLYVMILYGILTISDAHIT